METVIVEVSVPAINEKFDFKLPSTALIRNVVEEMVRVLEITQQNVQFDSDALLCDRDSGCVLDPGKTIGELRIQDGSRLQLL